MRATLPAKSRPWKPSTLNLTSWPTLTRGISEAGTWASKVSSDRLTMLYTGMSGASFSPACTWRLLTTPLIGALMTPSFSAMRAISTIAAADLTLARARSTLFCRIVGVLRNVFLLEQGAAVGFVLVGQRQLGLRFVQHRLLLLQA